MQRRLGIGIAGCGSVLKAYLPVIEKLDYRGQARWVMTCDLRDQALAQAVKDYGVEAATTDYRCLVDDPRVDVVLILTSMAEHASIAQAALEAGKHVLVEKPLATTLADGKALLELAGRSPGYLLAAPHVILSPTFQAIAYHIRQGDIGKPLSARARYGWSGPWWSRWFYQGGGGALFDLAPYNLTTLTGLIGPVKRVTALAGTAIPTRMVEGELIDVRVEDNAQVLLDFGEAVFGVVTAGFTMQQYRSPAIEIYGSQGTIQMLGDDWDPDGYELWENAAGAWKVYKETEPDWSWCSGLSHLVECIHQGKPPIIRPEHALHVLEIMIKAKEAAQDGVTRAIESTFPSVEISSAGQVQQAHLVHDRTHKL